MSILSFLMELEAAVLVLVEVAVLVLAEVVRLVLVGVARLVLAAVVVLFLEVAVDLFLEVDEHFGLIIVKFKMTIFLLLKSCISSISLEALKVHLLPSLWSQFVPPLQSTE